MHKRKYCGQQSSSGLPLGVNLFSSSVLPSVSFTSITACQCKTELVLKEAQLVLEVQTGVGLVPAGYGPLIQGVVRSKVG